MKILSNHLVYANPQEYAAFPSVAIDSDGALYCVFRLAPTRKSKTHIDTRSIAVLMKSKDEGETWEKVSEIRNKDYSGGIQDPSLAIFGSKDPVGGGWLVEEVFVLNYFEWMSRTEKHTKKSKKVRVGGPFIRYSTDSGKTWGERVFPKISFPSPPMPVSEPVVQSIGCFLFAAYADMGGGGDSCWLFKGKGDEWEKPVRIAHDPTGNLNFQEPALLSLGVGHLLCLMRVPTPGGDVIYQAHSWDGGQTWESPRRTGIEGLPPSLLQLRDERILCTYGYRKPPYEIRVCLSQNEGVSWGTGEIKVIRANGGGWDIGYPSTVQLPGGDLFTVYYWYDAEDKTRRIEGTRWKI